MRLTLFITAVLFSGSLFCQSAASTATENNLLLIRGRVVDSSSGGPLPARIVIRDEKGKVINSYYDRLNGFFTEEDGSFQQQLQPGNYTLAAYHGIDYLSKKISFTVSDNKQDSLKIALARWYPLKEKGWINGDGHDHLYTDVKQDSLMIDTVRRICLAQGVDFMCAAQGWAGYNDDNWREGYAKFSDERFSIYYGSEMPKYRTGHTWWMGQESTRNIYWQTMDTTYENHYYQSEHGTSWNFDSLKFPNIPDVEVVKRFRDADDAIAVMAHPTSWWWQKRGSIEKYVTNVAGYLSFGLLAGKIWEGQVVMGYDHDHYHYQNLWFNVLNQGYRMAALSELDGGYGRGDKFYYGAMRTYYHIDGKFSIDKVNDAIRKGRTFVTSGPIVMTNIDNKYRLGDIIPANGKKHVLNIEAYASGDADDHLSYVIVFRNGKLLKVWDIKDRGVRKFTQSLMLNENERAWYVVKVYGKSAWKSGEMLDVMRVCDKRVKQELEMMEEERDVAITSPYYFRPAGSGDPARLVSNIDLTVKPAVANAKAEIMLNGKTIKTVNIVNGRARFSMPVDGVVKITAAGRTPVYRYLYFDYLPHRDLLEQLATGRWMKKFEGIKFNPGEVPWEAFQYDATRKMLQDVRWETTLEPNERDALWEPFERIFIEEKAGKNNAAERSARLK